VSAAGVIVADTSALVAMASAAGVLVGSAGCAGRGRAVAARSGAAAHGVSPASRSRPCSGTGRRPDSGARRVIEIEIDAERHRTVA
jgi:hypothetical protein